MGSLLEKLKRNQRRGSKPRCHWLTHGAPRQVASRLNALTEPWGSVSAGDRWMPEGFDQVDEAQLHRSHRLLRMQDCEASGGCRNAAMTPRRLTGTSQAHAP